MSALFRYDGEFYRPGPLTVGPWSPDAQHGGAVSALLAGAVESDDPAMPVVRLTLELVRPVPLTPLRLTTDLVRPGRNVQLVDAFLWSGDTEVARARALRIRRTPMDVPVDRSGPPAPPPTAEESADQSGVVRTAFADAVDMHFVKGSWDDLGPVTLWTRLRVPVVEGRTVTPLQRTAAAADFGNGISRILDFETHTFINPDLTVALARVPEGEWILLDVVSRLSGDGFGQAESQIFDATGPVGRSIQSLLVTSR
ncbi:MAG TPA: thioesterase family protein [Acidimicrobiales bacterium]|nr:thioesterase family protein [Acidimicrobiales bacterium]